MKRFNFILVIAAMAVLASCGGPKEQSSVALPVELLNGEDSVKVFQTPDGGQLGVQYIGHGSVRFVYNEKNIYVDPYSKQADFTNYPQADYVFVSHGHGDHYDTVALNCIATAETEFICGKSVPQYNDNYTVVAGGDSIVLGDFSVDIVEAYNIPTDDPEARIPHPKGEGVGFFFDFGGCRVYVAGDTEPTEEMMALTGIDIAFLPKNLPYTMSDEQFVETANALAPKYLYPYHYFQPLDFEALRAGISEEVIMLQK